MAVRRKVAIVAYNGIDGACSAAMALLRFPASRVVVSSARSIGQTMQALSEEDHPPTEIHVCGLGVYCDWDALARPAQVLRDKGTTITWYCGRGYLNDQRKQFEEMCVPAFLPASSNTEAVGRHLGVDKDQRAGFLMQLARTDPNVESPKQAETELEWFWLDLISASFAEYAKYGDRGRYEDTIRKLAAGQSDAGDRAVVEIYRRHGFKYVLQGHSPALQRLRVVVCKCAAVDEPVLILGESGVGKEHIAHLIHERSHRATEQFVPVNCADFSGNVGLANSRLFGHCKGAFTGAVKDRQGVFQAASGGVLFLDEVGELPPEVQGKLLRVLEDGMVTPEGADKPVFRANVRLIAATNRDLPSMVRKGDFRGDLFHRLAPLRIKVPPLRERAEDVDPIADQALADLEQAGWSRKLSKAERKALHDYDWPGNARQLIGVLRRAVYLEMSIPDVIEEERGLGGLVEAAEVGTQEGVLPTSVDQIQPIREVQRLYAKNALNLTGGNIRATARILGIAVNTLQSWLKGDG